MLACQPKEFFSRKKHYRLHQGSQSLWEGGYVYLLRGYRVVMRGQMEEIVYGLESRLDRYRIPRAVSGGITADYSADAVKTITNVNF